MFDGKKAIKKSTPSYSLENGVNIQCRTFTSDKIETFHLRFLFVSKICFIDMTQLIQHDTYTLSVKRDVEINLPGAIFITLNICMQVETNMQCCDDVLCVECQKKELMLVYLYHFDDHNKNFKNL